MEDQTVWPPTPSNQVPLSPPPRKLFLPLRILLRMVFLGFALGVFDVFRADNVAEWLTVAAAAVLGFFYPRTVVISVFLLSLCLYLSHITAIEVGLKRPYVEPDVDSALFCWLSLVPYGIGGLVGVLAKAITRAQQAKQ